MWCKVGCSECQALDSSSEKFSVRGDGLVTVTGSLSVVGTASMSSTLSVQGILTAATGLTVSSGGLSVRFVFLFKMLWNSGFDAV